MAGEVTSFLMRKGLGRLVDQVSLEQILALAPQELYDLGQSNVAYQERTGASATTPSAVADPIGSYKNLGTNGGWLTAPSDAARPIHRLSASGKPYLEADGTDDSLTGAHAALRVVAGWTIGASQRNDGSTAAAHTLLHVAAATTVGRARMAYLITSGLSTVSGRRGNTDGTASVNGLVHAAVDVDVVGLGDYTNTDATIRANRVQEGINSSWLTAGNTPNDLGDVGLFSTVAGAEFFAGRLYRAAVFPAVLTGADLTLFERWLSEGR